MRPRTTEKIIVNNGHNLVEVADTTLNRQGRWNTGTRRQITISSHSNRVTIGLTLRYGSVISANIQSTVALSSQTMHQQVIRPVVPPAPVSGYQLLDSLETAVYRAAWMIIENLPEGANVAVLSIATPDTDLAEIIIGIMEMQIWLTRKFNLVDRRTLDTIRAEHQLQYSGEVDDNSAVDIGRISGASVVVTGSVNQSGRSQDYKHEDNGCCQKSRTGGS